MIPVNTPEDNETAFLLAQQQRDARFQEMTQMEGAGVAAPGQYTGVPGGPPTGRRIASVQRQSSAAKLAEMQSQQRAINAKAPPAVHELRRRMDDKNTDKYYRSAEVSAIGDQMADGTTMAPGQTRPTSNRFRSGQLRQLDERNTDRYYRDSLERGLTVQQANKHNQQQRGQTHLPVPKQGSTVQPVQHGQAVHPLIVATREDIRPAVEQAAGLIKHGVPCVVISITGPISLHLPTQTAVDSLVTRGVLTEDQGRDIKIDMIQVGTADVVKGGFAGHSVNQVYGDPAAQLAAAPPAVAEEPLGDPRDFLNAPDDEPEGSLAEPTMPTQLDPNTDGDDNDFLSPPEMPSAASGIGPLVGNTAALDRVQFAEERDEPAVDEPPTKPAATPPSNKNKHKHRHK